MRLLQRPRPQVDVAQLRELAVEAEHLLGGPGLDDQVVRFQIFLAQQRRGFAVTEVGVHRGADRKAGDQAPAAEHVEHREFLGHPNRRIVQRDRIAQHDQVGARGAPRQRRRHDVGRRHHAVAVLMMLVDAQSVEASLIGELQRVEILVVKLMADLGVVEAARNIHPDAAMLLFEIVRQIPIGHQMEPREFHKSSPLAKFRCMPAATDPAPRPAVPRPGSPSIRALAHESAHHHGFIASGTNRNSADGPWRASAAATAREFF